MKKQTLLMAALAGTVAASAPAQSLFDWTFTASGTPSPGIPLGLIGSGTLTVDTSPTDYSLNGGYAVESMTGTLDGYTISNVAYPGAALLANITGAPGQLEDDLTFNFVTPPSGPYYYVEGDSDYFLSLGSSPNDDLAFWLSATGTFSATPAFVSPVPESPANPGLMAAAGLFICWRSWRAMRGARA